MTKRDRSKPFVIPPANPVFQGTLKKIHLCGRLDIESVPYAHEEDSPTYVYICRCGFFDLCLTCGLDIEFHSPDQSAHDLGRKCHFRAGNLSLPRRDVWKVRPRPSGT
jgi:hypothetical protein